MLEYLALVVDDHCMKAQYMKDQCRQVGLEYGGEHVPLPYQLSNENFLWYVHQHP